MASILWILLGQTLSLIGSSMQMTAIPLYILKTTGSGALLSLFQIVSVVTAILFSPIAGYCSDRFNRKHLVILSDVVSFVLVLGIYFAFLLGVGSVGVLMAFQALGTVSECILLASLFAIVPELAPPDKLTRINGIKNAAYNTAFVVGPVLGGLAYSFAGIENIFLVNALSFLLSALAALAVRYRASKAAKEPPPTASGIMESLRESALYLKAKPKIRKIIFFAVFVNMLDTPIFQVILPVFVISALGMTSQQFGAIQGFYAVGIVVGGLLLALLHVKDSSKSIRPVLLVQCCLTLALSALSLPLLSTSFASIFVICSLVSVIGVFNSIGNIAVQSTVQSSTDPMMLGRLGALMSVGFQSTVPIGLMIAGLMIDHVQIAAVFIPFAAAFLIYTLAAGGRILRE